MKIAMIDPSLFTLPYDLALCHALRAKGCGVTLHGRELRPLESVAGEDVPRVSFYKWTEKFKGRAPAVLFNAMKGLEHAADMVRLVRSFRDEPPSIVHFQWSPLPTIDKLAIRDIRASVGPVVLTVHDAKPFNNSPTSVVQRIGSTDIWREFDHLIVHSESSRNLLRERGIPAEQISVAAHGILDTLSTSARSLRTDAPLTILLFGRVKAYKGVDVMIEALGRLPAQLRGRCHVLVVGEPMIPMEPLKERAAALGVARNITWDLRYVSDADMGEVFSQADIFAFPYREIDTSGVLMSCLPYGKPIIASAIGAFPTLLRDGTHGRIVPPNDPHALAEAIASLLNDPSMLTTCGHNVALLSGQIPSWDAIAGQTIALYDVLIRSRMDAPRGAPVGAMAA
jgi:glycosyltransferase involved in cell wall biosynthesis